jgi:enamine deaminase RidA (YjgF/YER057c/UK114 family)
MNGPLAVLLFGDTLQGQYRMSGIERHGVSQRWSEIVVHNSVAYWVEVADDSSQDVRGQVAQVLAQIDATLARIGSDRSRLLMIQIYLADLADAPVINEVWDAWTPEGNAPVRACVQAGLSGEYRVEMVVTAAAGQGAEE